MLQTSYRSTDSPPTSKVEVLNEYCSNEVVPSETMAHPIECDPKENPFNVMYVRSGLPPAGDSKLMYDLGVTHLAVSGQLASDNVIGDLWVTYEVELKKPIIDSNVTSTIFSSQYNFIGINDVANLFDTTKVSAITGDVLATFAGGNNTVYIAPGRGGRVLVTIRYSGASNWTATTCSNVPTALTNCMAAPWAAGTSTNPVGTNCTG
jgi:hypothetical protein